MSCLHFSKVYIHIAQYMSKVIMTAPPRGLSTPRTLKVKTNFEKQFWVVKYVFSYACTPHFACAKLYTMLVFPEYPQAP